MKDAYSVLGLEQTASREEFAARYEFLKNKYSEDRFLDGETGNLAAHALEELEAAYKIILDDLEKADAKAAGAGDYFKIDSLIKAGKYDEAQGFLDAESERGAEWHFLQSIIFYKKDWINESRAQLQIAVNMDPSNVKYKTALDRMEQVTGNPNQNPNGMGNPPPNYDPARDMGARSSNTCANCCFAYICTDCCCNMLRCCG